MVAAREAFRGVTVPLVTPFDPRTLDVDHERLAAHTDWLIGEGVHGVLAADFVGESWALTTGEKIAVVRTVAEVSDGRVPVVAKLSEPSLRGQVALARAISSFRVDAVKVAVPKESRAADEEQLFRWLVEPAEDVGIPFFVEGNADLPFEVLETLCTHELFIGYEEASRDLSSFVRLTTEFGDDITIVAGSEDVLVHTLLAGAHGLMTATPNFAPAFMTALFDAAAASDIGRTLEFDRRLRSYRQLFFEDLRQGVFAFVPYTKESLELVGRSVGPPRSPLKALGLDQRQALGQVLDEKNLASASHRTERDR